MSSGTALSREAFLSYVGQLEELELNVAGMGVVLCRELTGAQRAKVLETLAPALQEGGRADLTRYQQMLMQLGLIDPGSPKDAREPLLDLAGAIKAMDLGAAKVEAICGAIERLSGLDRRAPERAEGNSEATPSVSATSG